MPELTRPIADEISARLEKLKPDTKPAWGKLTAPELVPHLIGSIKHSTGGVHGIPFQGNWFFRNILGPLALADIIPLPKNVPIKSNGKKLPAISEPGDLGDLRRYMVDYIKGVESGTLKTGDHPYFGEIGPKGWSKLHVKHMRHHLKQFGL